MQDEQIQKIQEAAWRRPLTPEEEAALRQYLAGHPALGTAWKEEMALTKMLETLSAPVVSSNFTARLLQAAQATKVRPSWRSWFAPSQWLPEGLAARVALCSMMLCASVISAREYQAVHRAHVARELASVSRVATLPRLEWLKDFDTIDRMNKVKVADDELLAALK